MDKKSIRQQNIRKNQEKKLQEALAKKPTISQINSLGLTPAQYAEFLKNQNTNKKEFFNEKRIKNAKIKRFNNQRPKILKSVHDISLNFMNTPKIGQNLAEIHESPDWFQNNQPVDVSIIVPMYKSHSVILDLIKSFPLKHRNSWEIIFVDDVCPTNSTKHVLDAWEKRKEEIKRPIGKIIKNKSNLGYGGSCNVGASYALGKYLIFLNADTTMTEGWIDPMIDVHSDEKVGIVGNMQLKEGGDFHGSIDSAGSEWLWSERSFVHVGRHSYKRKIIQTPYYPSNCPKDILQVSERDMVTGCCFSISKDLFDYIGGFNPNYHIGYWEDSEICMNVRELGYKVMFQPNSVIYHKLGHTKSGSHPYHKSNEKYFQNKWVKSHRIDRVLIEGGRGEKEDPVNSILIQRANAHGDVLVASGVCKGLKKQYPNAKITFATIFPEVIKNNPYIDEIIEKNQTKNQQFDVFYNLDGCYELRPKVNILNSYAEAVGVKTDDCEVVIHKDAIEGLPENYVVIHPGQTDWAGRDWPEKNFIELSNKLMQKGINVVTVGNYTEFDIPSTLNLKGKTTIHQMAYVIANAKAFVGIDSFPMHVAQAVKTPGVCFFGCIKPESRIYVKNMIGVSANELSCIGCHHRKPPPQYATKICETKDQACTKLVTVGTMLFYLQQIMENKN